MELFEALLPRHLEIIYEINRRFLDDVKAKHPGDDAKLARVSLIEEKPERKVRMANLAIVGTHSTNGVAAIHSQLLRTKTVPDFAELFPERFNNKTNGVTPRRWLLLANPDLAKLLTEAVGDGWITDLALLRRRPTRWRRTPGFRKKFLAAKRAAKARFVDWIKTTAGITLDPDTLFDVPDQADPRVQAATARTRSSAWSGTTGCGRTRSSMCRRGRCCSPARRPRPTTSPRSSSSSSPASRRW